MGVHDEYLQGTINRHAPENQTPCLHHEHITYRNDE